MTNRKFITQLLLLKIKICDSDLLLLKNLPFRFANIWRPFNKFVAADSLQESPLKI